MEQEYRLRANGQVVKIQRRLAWSLHKDDTLYQREAAHFLPSRHPFDSQDELYYFYFFFIFISPSLHLLAFFDDEDN